MGDAGDVFGVWVTLRAGGDAHYELGGRVLCGRVPRYETAALPHWRERQAAGGVAYCPDCRSANVRRWRDVYQSSKGEG